MSKQIIQDRQNEGRQSEIQTTVRQTKLDKIQTDRQIERDEQMDTVGSRERQTN